MIAAPFLLIACAGNNVVTEPVALKGVNPGLLAKPKLPECKRPEPRAGRDDVRLWAAYADCHKARADAFYERLTGLQRAVIVRERAAAKAVATAKKL